MPESEPDHTTIRLPGELNDPQQRRLRVTCQYIDKLLSDIESVLHAAASKSPFPRYVVDIAPAQSRVIEDHIHRLRSQLLRTLAWQHMEPNPPEIPAIRAVMTDLAFIDIAVEELKPSYLKGYGAVPEDAVDQLNGVVHELRSLVEGMERYVRQGARYQPGGAPSKTRGNGLRRRSFAAAGADRYPSRPGGISIANRFACFAAGGRQPRGCSIRTSQQWQILTAERASWHGRSSGGREPDHGGTHRSCAMGQPCARRSPMATEEVRSSRLKSFQNW